MAVYLYATVSGKTIAISRRYGPIVCCNDDYRIKFNFDEEWKSVPDKMARFVYNGVYYDIPATADTAGEYIVAVPRLHGGAGNALVGVYSMGDTSICTTPAVVTVIGSIMDLDGVPHEGQDMIYASVAQQAAWEANDAAIRAESAGTQAENSRDEIETWLDEGTLGPTYPIVRSSETSIPTVDGKYYFLQPEVYYVFGEVDTLPLTLCVPSDKKIHEHAFEFTPTENFTGLEFKESEPSWVSILQFTPGKTCQVSIVRGIGVAASVL